MNESLNRKLNYPAESGRGIDKETVNFNAASGGEFNPKRFKIIAEPSIKAMTAKSEKTLSTIKRVLIYALLATSLVGMTPALARNGILFTSDFENRTTNGWGRQDGKLPGATTVQSNTVRAGKYAVRLHMKRCSFIEPKCKPSPVGINAPRAQLGIGGGVRFAINTPYWLGFSVFVPKNWEFTSKTHTSFLEIHESNRGKGPGTCNRSPQPLGFNIRGNRWGYVHTNNVGKGEVRKDLAPVETGRWTDFVANWKWSTKNDGYIKIWKNGKQIVNFKGSTVCHGQNRSGAKDTLPYLNATIYKAGWKRDPSVTQVTAYYDEIRVGGPSASYRDVAPHGAARAADSNTPAAKATIAAQRKPVARKKPVSRKKFISLKTCEKYKGQKRKNCRRRVYKHNKSITK